MERKKISFDYDDTLSFKQVQKVAKELSSKYELYIVTARPEVFKTTFYTNTDIKEVAKRLGATIIFMGYEPKYEFFKDKNFLFHLDDSAKEIEEININTDVLGIHFTGKGSLELLNKILKYDK